MLARRRIAAVLVVVFGLFVAACGSSNEQQQRRRWRQDLGGGGTRSPAPRSSMPNSMNNPPKGTVKYCQGKDTTGSAKALIKDFNAKYCAQGYKAKLTEFPASADAQRTQFIQRQQAKSDDCDVFSSDVIWTAEFSSQKWLYDLTPYIERASKYIAAPLETVHYGGKYWGVPETSDAAFIYYRTTRAPARRPRPGSRSTRTPRRRVALVYQGAPYEGLTCDYLELAFAAGGTVLYRRRQEVDDQLAGEHQGAAAHGRRHQERRGPQGRHDLHGAGDRPGVDQRQVRLHAQLDLRLRGGQQERRARSRASTRSPRCRPSRAAARPASSAATTA